MTTCPYAITCPNCGSERSRVRDSRGVSGMNTIRRRRHCMSCAHRFNTYESTAVPEEHILSQKIETAMAAINVLTEYLNDINRHIRGKEYDPTVRDESRLKPAERVTAGLYATAGPVRQSVEAYEKRAQEALRLSQTSPQCTNGL